MDRGLKISFSQWERFSQESYLSVLRAKSKEPIKRSLESWVANVEVCKRIPKGAPTSPEKQARPHVASKETRQLLSDNDWAKQGETLAKWDVVGAAEILETASRVT